MATDIKSPHRKKTKQGPEIKTTQSEDTDFMRNTQINIDAVLSYSLPIRSRITDKQPGAYYTVNDILRGNIPGVRDNQKKINELIAEGKEKSEIQKAKMQFPNAQWFISGDTYSGLYALDFDGVEDYTTFAEKIAEIGAFAVKRSVTGKGAHVLFISDNRGQAINKIEFKNRLNILRTYIYRCTGYQADTQCIEVMRKFYISGYPADIHPDTAISINDAFLDDDMDDDLDLDGAMERDQVARYYAEVVTEVGEPNDGNWDNVLSRFAAKCEGAHINRDIAVEFAFEKFEPYNIEQERLIRNKFTQKFNYIAEKEKTKAVERDSRIVADKFRILTTDDIKPPTAVLNAPDGEMIVSEGNFCLVLGKAKTKKTFFTQLLVADYIGNSIDLADGEILFFDTEQSPSHVQKIAKRLKTMGGGYLDENGFCLFALRELMPQDRVEFIKRVCRKKNPKLIIIDGIVDICLNFMDLEKSTDTVQMLMTLSAELECAIIGILHENKGKEDKNGRGHLGTIATQKAETVINLSSVQGTDLVQVEFTYTRNIAPQPFTFHIDADGLPTISVNGLPTIPKNYDLWRDRCEEPTGFADLVRRVMADTGKSERTAKRHIDNATMCGVIVKNSAGQYQLNAI